MMRTNESVWEGEVCVCYCSCQLVDDARLCLMFKATHLHPDRLSLMSNMLTLTLTHSPHSFCTVNTVSILKHAQ